MICAAGAARDLRHDPPPSRLGIRTRPVDSLPFSPGNIDPAKCGQLICGDFSQGHGGKIITLNQAHFDDVPMPMPDGAAPPLAWALQAGGATFDPPVENVYPHMSGLRAGSMAYFLSFNHDTNRFEIVATGHVLDDGLCIVTDLGAGITTAGWGCNSPPYSSTGDVCKCASCDRCESEVRDTNPPTCLTLTKRR